MGEMPSTTIWIGYRIGGSCQRAVGGSALLL
jgi:hypothetical protein